MRPDEEIFSTLGALTKARDVDGIARFGEELAKERPLPPRIIMTVAQALRDSGAQTTSLAWFERVKPTDRQYDFSRAQMARILNSAGEYKKALQLTERYPDHSIPEALAIVKARALLGLGKKGEVLGFVERFEKHQTAPSILLEIAADAAAGSVGWPQALSLLERAATRSPDQRLRLRRGVALFHVDRLDEALCVLQEVSESPDHFVRAKAFAVRIYQRTGLSDEALQSCRDILEKEPANEFALESIVRQYIEIRDFPLARAAFEEAHQANPARFPLEVYDFLVLERDGRLRKALKPFKDEALNQNLTDEIKERIATSFYFSGQYSAARKLAKLLVDPERCLLIQCKVAMAIGNSVNLARLPVSRDGMMVKALSEYLTLDYDNCVATLNELIDNSRREKELGLNNLRALAVSGRLLSNLLFGEATGIPIVSDELPVIQQLWVGGDLSYIELLSIRSFIANGHETHLYTYDPKMNAPLGCILKDAREILPESDIFVHSAKTGRSKGSLAGFADRFRWKLVHDKGGAWADCDVICLAPIASRQIVSTELARVGTLIAPAITNCFFAAEPGERAFLRAFEQASAVDAADLHWGEIGIHKMAEVVSEEGWGERLTAPTDLCPIPPFLIVDAITGSIDVERVLGATKCRAVHLYNEVMRMVGMDKNGTFPENGLIGILEKRVSERERQRGVGRAA